MANEEGPEMSQIQDDVLGLVMTLGPMRKTADAAEFVRGLGIPDVTERTLTNARRRGEITASVFGVSIVYAERDLLEWVASRYGNGNDHYASRGVAISAAMNAKSESSVGGEPT